MQGRSQLDGCPSGAELASFAAGKLVASRFDRVAAHVENCADCEDRLARIEAIDDPLVDGIKGTSTQRISALQGEVVPGCLLDRARSLANRKTLADDGPKRLGKYELLEEIGSGSFGSVYRAHDAELDRIVAIKLLRVGSLASESDIERFVHEARSSAQLKHPSIVLLYGIGRSDEGIHFLVEEFVEGGTLAKRLKQDRPGFRVSAELVSALARALDYAHCRGVIHRDLKPSNIVIDRDGRPHLMVRLY